MFAFATVAARLTWARTSQSSTMLSLSLAFRQQGRCIQAAVARGAFIQPTTPANCRLNTWTLAPVSNNVNDLKAHTSTIVPARHFSVTHAKWVERNILIQQKKLQIFQSYVEGAVVITSSCGPPSAWCRLQWFRASSCHLFSLIQWRMPFFPSFWFSTLIGVRFWTNEAPDQLKLSLSRLGIEAIVVDYIRPSLFGGSTTIPNIAQAGVWFLSAVTLGGLFYFNYTDVGIVNAIKMLWKVWRALLLSNIQLCNKYIV